MKFLLTLGQCHFTLASVKFSQLMVNFKFINTSFTFSFIFPKIVVTIQQAGHSNTVSSKPSLRINIDNI